MLAVAVLGLLAAGACLAAADGSDRNRLERATRELVADLRLMQTRAMNCGTEVTWVISFSCTPPYGYTMNRGKKRLPFKELERVELFCDDRNLLSFATNGFPSEARRIILRAGRYKTQVVIDVVGRIRVDGDFG